MEVVSYYPTYYSFRYRSNHDHPRPDRSPCHVPRRTVPDITFVSTYLFRSLRRLLVTPRRLRRRAAAQGGLKRYCFYKDRPSCSKISIVLESNSSAGDRIDILIYSMDISILSAECGETLGLNGLDLRVGLAVWKIVMR
jgi:hypothetical protein